MVMASEEDKSIQEVLSLPILLADRVIKSAQEAESFKAENSDLSRQVTQLSQLLRSAARLTSSSSSSAVYDRPIRRVSVDITKALERALNLARKCRHKKTNVLHHVLSITTTTDFKKVSALLDSSLADMKWVLSIFNQDPSDYETALPPFACNDPILAWVWPAVAAAHMGRAEAAQELASLAKNSDRNKKIIVEENGIPPLLKMLKESSNADGQSAAAAALCNLADDEDRVNKIADKSGVRIIAKALSETPARVQVILVTLVSKMAGMNPTVQEEFGRENVTRPLVTLLGMDVDLEEFVEANTRKNSGSLHSLVQIKKGNTTVSSSGSLDGSRHNRKEKEKEKERDAEPELPELKSRLKISCAAALCILARRSSFNSGKITDTKALLVLAKIIEKEQGELKMNCLKVVMELAAVAESNTELKRAAFRPTSTAAKVVFDQLLRVINEEASASMVIQAVKAIGCLASMFPAKEKRIVQSLVAKLGHKSPDVAAEAAKALCKFVCDENYNRREHSEAIMEFDGVASLLRSKDRGGGQHELVLLCNLAINAGNNKALEQGGALSVLEGAARHAVAQNPELRELFAKAINHLTIYQAGLHHAHRRP